MNPRLKQIDFAHDVVEKRDDFNTAKLIALELEEGGGSEELAALGWQQCRDVHELIVVDAFCLVVWLREVVF